MPPRSLSERSPVSVMRWDDNSTICSLEMKPQSKGNPTGRRLRFADENHVMEIPHLDDISDDEVEATWYSAKEYSDIKSSYQLTIFMMESGEHITGDEHTPRGLEYRTQEGAWARYENKRDAYNSVLDEQDRQWKVDKDDFEKLREIYLQHSTKCAQAAVVRALQDEKDIKEYLAEVALKPKKKKKKIIVVKKKKKKTSSNDSVTSYESDGNATDTSAKSSRSTKSVSKKKAKEITAKLKRRAAAAGTDKVMNERSSITKGSDAPVQKLTSRKSFNSA